MRSLHIEQITEQISMKSICTNLNVEGEVSEGGDAEGVAVHVADAHGAVLRAEGEQTTLAPRAAGDGLGVLADDGDAARGLVVVDHEVAAVRPDGQDGRRLAPYQQV